MLAPRFEFDGTATRDLNQLQRETRDRIREKIESGAYKFDSIRCPICEAEQKTTLAEKDRYGLYHPVGLCRNCGLIRTDPRMTQSSFAEFYDTEYRYLYDGEKNWEADRFDSQYRRAGDVYEYLSQHVPDMADARILDVGCGPGGMLSFFQSRGNTVIGCDLDGDAVAFGYERDIPIRQGSIEQIAADWEPDVVILSHVVEHFTTPIDTLQSIRSVVDNDSFLYIEAPGVKYLSPRRSYFKADFLRQLQNAHTFYFTARTLANLLSRAGFEAVDVDESIRGIFVISNIESGGFESDYHDALSHLQRLERYRKCRLHWYGRAKQLPYKPSVIRELKRFKIYPIAKRIEQFLSNQ